MSAVSEERLSAKFFFGSVSGLGAGLNFLECVGRTVHLDADLNEVIRWMWNAGEKEAQSEFRWVFDQDGPKRMEAKARECATATGR